MSKYKFSVDDFKDVSGRWRNRSLFVETNENEKKYPSPFTLKEDDYKGRLSLKRLYMELDDPTEYLPAMRIFGSIDCWNQLCECKWFKPHIEKWRAELQTRVKSEAVGVIREAAKIGDVNAQQLNAAKWLATQQWEGNEPKQADKRTPGRPPKLADPEERLKAALDAEAEKDLERLGLTH